MLRRTAIGVIVLCLALLSGPGWAQAPGGQHGGRIRELLQQLDLSQDQKEQLMPLLRSFMQTRKQEAESRKSQLASILSADQMQKMKQLQAQGLDRRSIMQQIGLSAQQRQQLRAMWQRNGGGRGSGALQQLLSQTKEFLSADQQAKLEAFLSQQRGGQGGQHQQRRQQQPPQPNNNDE